MVNKIKYITNPINPGATATLIAQVKPEVVCRISIYYKSGSSKAQGLYLKTTDKNGDVSWTWKIGTRTTPGSWKIVVKSNHTGKATSLITYLAVF